MNFVFQVTMASLRCEDVYVDALLGFVNLLQVS